MSKTPDFRRLGLLAVVAVLAVSATLSGETVRNHFDSDSPIRAPGFFDLAVLGTPGPARWLILTDPNPPSTPNRLVQVERNRPADSIAAAIRRSYAFQDGAVSTYLRQGAGRAGLILRMAGQKDFLLLLVDTASGQAVLWSYRAGKAAELGRGPVAFARPWEKVGVTASGANLSVLFNDQKIFDAADPQPVSGRAGLAAAGPGESSFDEFVMEFAAGPGGSKP